MKINNLLQANCNEKNTITTQPFNTFILMLQQELKLDMNKNLINSGAISLKLGQNITTLVLGIYFI